MQQNLAELEKSLRINYAASLEKLGLVFQPKKPLSESANLSSTKRPRLESNSSSSIENEMAMHVPSEPFPSPLLSSTPKKRVDSTASDKPLSTSVNV